MKITRRQLRRIIREAIVVEARPTNYDQLPYSMGGPWVDKDAPVGKGAKEYDDLDTELTDKEIEDAMGWEPAGDEEVFWKEGDLVRKVDYHGDGRGGDYEKSVGDQIGTVIEIDEDIDGTQYTVIFPDGTTVMDTADSFETIKEALQFPDDVLVDSDSQDYQQGYADAYDGLKMQKNQSQQYQNGWDDGHFDIIRDNEPYGGASA